MNFWNESLPSSAFVPHELAEELLQRPRYNTRFQGYGFNAFLRRIGDLG